MEKEHEHTDLLPHSKEKKITTRKEFWPLLEEYQKLALDPSSTVQKLSEHSKKINEFLESYTSKLASASANRKASFLLKFDSKMNAHGPIPQQKYYAEYGSTHIASFLKLAFYKDLFIGSDALLPGALDYKNPETMKKLNELPLEKKTNRVIDSIAAQIFQASSNKELFLAVCDWMIEESRSTRKIIRIAEIFSRILAGITKKRAKFLQGFLYTFGGILKAEAFSYLKTILDPAIYQGIEQYIDENEKRFIRELDKAEVDTFEKHMPEAMAQFFSALSAPITMKHALTSANEDYLYNLTLPELVDEYDDEHKKRSAVVNPVEATHYSFMFGFDTLAFHFCFLLRPDEEGKPLGLEDRDNLKKLVESTSKLMDKSLSWKFMLPGSEAFINAILKTLLEICPDPLVMLRLNKTRLANSPPAPAFPIRKGTEEPTYDRTTQYNQVGAALFFYLVFADYHNVKVGSPPFPLLVTKEYMFELYVPLLKALFEVPVTARFGIDLLHAFVVSSRKLNLEKYENNSGFIENFTGLLLVMANFIGGQANEALRYMGYAIFPKVLELLPMNSRVTVCEKLVQKLEADGAKAMVIDCLKSYIIKPNAEFKAETAGKIRTILMKLFADNVKVKDNLLEIKETVSALLILYKALITKDKQVGLFGIVSDKHLQENVQKEYLDPIRNLVKLVVGEEESKTDKNEGVKIPEEILKAYKKEQNQLEILRFLIADIESTLSQH
eukprot:TRINITY_DN153_c0_g1_i4.p2 TRINITY_DN153_c0_g1~~TRINITY_DN153_c0_g1_i4.p2  ORF type:complete len:726 (+),score=98.81 TRINITY_DN153_c0_g1_i4:4187-6364(+)